VCYELCKNCTGKATYCTECQNVLEMELIDFECRCKSIGYYKYTDPITHKDSCKQCDRLCKRCHGPTKNDCDECRTDDILHLAPIEGTSCKCELTYFDDSSKKLLAEICQKCADYCTRCENTPDNCQECVDDIGVLFLYGNKCLCKKTAYFDYYNTTLGYNQCVKCHPLCIDCNGPFPTQCDSCDSSIGAIFVSPRTCTCQPHFYYETSNAKCEICDALCGNCYGPTSTQCLTCNTANGAFYVENQSGLCVSDCEILDGYFRRDYTCKCIFFS